MTEIQTTARGKKPVDLVKEDESKALLLKVSPYAYSIAMDRGGKNWSTEQFAGKLESWSQQTNHFQFLIGGTFFEFATFRFVEVSLFDPLPQA